MKSEWGASKRQIHSPFGIKRQKGSSTFSIISFCLLSNLRSSSSIYLLCSRISLEFWRHMLKEAKMPWAIKSNLPFLALEALCPSDVEGADGDEGAAFEDEGAALEDKAPGAKLDA